MKRVRHHLPPRKNVTLSSSSTNSYTWCVLIGSLYLYPILIPLRSLPLTSTSNNNAPCGTNLLRLELNGVFPTPRAYIMLAITNYPHLSSTRLNQIGVQIFLQKMAFTRSRNLLQIADPSPRRRLLRPRYIRKAVMVEEKIRPTFQQFLDSPLYSWTAVKNLRASCKRLNPEMREISKDQEIIREGQRQVKEKLEAIETECTQLRNETNNVMRQSALNKLKLCLMFKILKAREEGDFDRATQLAQLLRSIITMAGQN